MALTGPVPMRGGILGSVLTVAGLLAGAAQAQDVKVQVTYLRVEEPPAVVLSNLDPIPEDRGIAGAQLGALAFQVAERPVGVVRLPLETFTEPLVESLGIHGVILQ